MMIILIILFLLKTIKNGTIVASGKKAINNTISNAKEKTNYIFNFTLTNSLKNGGIIKITFPLQYPENLGISSTEIKNIKCNTICELKNRSINFYFEETLEKEKLIELVIYNIYNPNQQGGVGNFYIQSIKFGEIIDENLRFGVIGISRSILNLNYAIVKLDSEGSDLAGHSSKYIFQFKNENYLPKNIFLRLYFPENTFGIDEFPPCRSFPIKNIIIKGSLLCEKGKWDKWDIIDVHGIDSFIDEKTTLAIVVLIQNPRFKQITNNFGIAVIRKLTNVIYERSMDIPGIQIQPGRILNIEFKAVDDYLRITRNKLMWFRLSFGLMNVLEEESVIKLVFPASLKLQNDFYLSKPTSFLVERGLLKRDEKEDIILEYDIVKNILIIKNFKEKNDFERIQLLLLIKTPDIPGESSPMEISTLNKELSGNIIDYDSQFAKISIEDIQSPEIFSYTMSDNMVYLEEKYIYSLTFYIKPTITVPKNGFIKFIFPESIISKEITKSDCYVQNSELESDMVESINCYKQNREIIVQISNPFYLGTLFKINFKNTFISPSNWGDYLVDITTTIQDSTTTLESYTQKIFFESLKFINQKIFLESSEANDIVLIKIVFEVPLDIPASDLNSLSSSFINSFIDIKLEPDGSFPIAQDLNFNVGNNEIIPCKGIFGLVQKNGNNIECKLLVGKEPRIRVKNYKEIKQGSKIGILIPNFRNLEGNTKFIFSIVEVYKNLYKELSNYTLSIYISSVLLPENIYDFSYLKNFYKINYMEIDKEFDLAFDLNFSQKVLGGESIIISLPTYSEGFCQFKKNIQCFIQEIKFECYCISKIDWIYIELDEFDEINPESVILKIKNLQWPAKVSKIFKKTYVRIVNRDKTTKTYYSYPSFLKPNSRSFTLSILNYEDSRKSSGNIYSFKFRTNIDIPLNSVFWLIFPSFYDLLQISPPLRIEFFYENYVEVNFRISGTKIIIEKLPFILKNKKFEIVVKGIRNPDYNFKIEGFDAKIYTDDNFLMIESLNFFPFSFKKDFKVFPIELKNIKYFPKNADTEAEYIFKINLKKNILKGSVLSITFPENYRVLPSVPKCNLSGVIKYYSNCHTSFQTVSLYIEEDYVFNKNNNELEFIIYNILNTDAGENKYFIVDVSYDNNVIMRSELEESHFSYLTKKANDIDILETDLNPLNEAEISNIFLKFLPSSDFFSYSFIDLIFPEIYDDVVADNLECFIIITDSKKVDCSIKKKKKLKYQI